jgi:hypothetical protein
MTEIRAEQELKVTVRLVFDGKEIQAIEKPFAVRESETESEESRTIDETVAEFMDGLQKIASENGYVISKEVIVQTTIALILYLVKQDAAEKTIEVQLTRPEVKENGDNADPS